MKFFKQQACSFCVYSPKTSGKQSSFKSKLLVLLLSLLISVTACTKKEEKTETAKQGAAATAARTVKVSSELLQRIPGDSWGFLIWQGDHKAYRRYADSPWSDSGDFTSMLQTGNEQLNKVADILSAAGLDPEEKETWQQLFSEAVFFLAPVSPNSASPGAVFRSREIDLAQKVTAVKNELEASGEDVKTLEIEGAKGISFALEPEEAVGGALETPRTVYLLVKEDVAVLGSNEQIVERVLANKEPSLPQVAASEQFRKATAGFPGEDDRFALGYIDLQKLIAANGKPDAASLQAASFALSMTDVPRANYRLLYDKESAAEWVQDLHPSTSADIVAALPTEPLLFVSIDGDAVRKAKEAAKEQLDAEPELAKQLAFVDKLARVGITARMAPSGQSLLPIPDFMLLFETEQPDQTREDLKTLVASLMKNSPIQGVSPWQEKKLTDGTSAHALMSPLGFGVFIAASNKLVVVASTEAQLKTALAKTDGQFTKSLKKPAEHVMVNQENLGNLYLNFGQIAALLENMGGLLAMYAPQDQGAQQLLQPEKIEALKKMGVMIGSVTISDGVLDVTSFYQ